MKYFKELVFSILWLILFSFLVHMMIGHFRHISIPNDEMDEQIEILKDFKTKIPSGSQTAFFTNIKDTGMAQLAYYQTQFGCSPMTLSDDAENRDCIIFYRSWSDGDSNMNFIHHCDTIYQRSGSSYTLMLLRKNKNK
jgi:hypothetical protein